MNLGLCVFVGQQNQPQSLMTDYSKAWEDYYKKQSTTSAVPSQPYRMWTLAQSDMLCQMCVLFAGQSSQQSSVQDYPAALAEYYRQQPYLFNPAPIQVTHLLTTGSGSSDSFKAAPVGPGTVEELTKSDH